MFFVYIIKSNLKNWFYVGLTEDVIKRLKQHNLGRTKSTKPHKPFKLIYTKEFNNRSRARDHGKFLKIRSNKEKLIKSLRLAEVAE